MRTMAMKLMCLWMASWMLTACAASQTQQAPQPEVAQTIATSTEANPFRGEQFYVDSESQAALAVAAAEGETAAMLKVIADQPQADWLGEWSGEVDETVTRFMDAAEQSGRLRVMILYNIPNRDCGSYSKGGLDDQAKYLEWIEKIAVSIGERKAAIVLEPDALGQLDSCLSPEDQDARLEMLQAAITRLRKNPNTSVYLDAGNANWVSSEEMAERLRKAGVAGANGFALNTSNYVATDKTIAYGEQISALLGGDVPFVVDTSRNGQGEAPEKAWCNPPGRGLGVAPTTDTGHPLVHAFLWLKRPGESDGTCNNAPAAGSWYEEQALELVENARL